MLGLGAALLDDADKTLRIPAAAYRSRAGTWLSASSDTPANRVKVCSVRESHLLAALEERLPAGSVQRGAKLVGADTSNPDGGVALSFDDGSRISGSAVVGADGACSTVRRLIFGEDASIAPIDTGMVSHSGLLVPKDGETLHFGLPIGGDEALLRNAAPTTSEDADEIVDALPPPRPFETLSQGRRFAMVPLAGGGAFWFATRPLAEGESSAVGFDGKAIGQLRAAYEGWHAPIPKVLHSAACEAAEAMMALRVSAASSSSRCGTHGANLRWERVYEVPRLESWHAADGRVVLLGDAAHGMQHNLAQGAACAIEGAFLLGEALASVGDDEHSLEGAFRLYQEVHEPRVEQCRALTKFTNLLGAPSTPATEAVRNAMAFVPQPLNSYVFDTALSLSLGESPWFVRERWPLPRRPASERAWWEM